MSAGAFQHHKTLLGPQVCCEENDYLSGCYDKTGGCFKNIYQDVFLNSVGIKWDQKGTLEASWTLGAVMCEYATCLRDVKMYLATMCNWRPNGECLVY